MEIETTFWSIVLVVLSYLPFQSALANSISETELKKQKITYYQNDNITNQVPYFDNRFRIDSELDEITILFYRISGSQPVILIRPDGSKIRVNDFDENKVQWFDEQTFDMIKIQKPMPGPWQAVGNILPNSQLLVVSDVKISVKPLPEIIFSGETLKVEGKLLNGDQTIENPSFKEVVTLEVDFFSTNNSKFENFGAGAIKVTSFRDDGRGLDEYINDNVFTGEFVLDFAPGEWEPVYKVILPMATRELKQTPVTLYKVPFEIQFEVSTKLDIPHKVIINLDPDFVDVNSLAFQGKIIFPNKKIKSFAIMEEQKETRIQEITNTESGVYHIKMSAFGKTINGREFRLVAPDISFFADTEKPVLASATKVNKVVLPNKSTLEIDKVSNLENESAFPLITKQQIEQEDKETNIMILISVGNAVIIIIVLVLFLLMRTKKPITK